MMKLIDNKKPKTSSLLLGLIFGILIASGYSIMSVIICSGLLICPKAWEPFVFIFLLVFLFITAFFTAIFLILFKLYKFFDISN